MLEPAFVAIVSRERPNGAAGVEVGEIGKVRYQA